MARIILKKGERCYKAGITYYAHLLTVFVLLSWGSSIESSKDRFLTFSSNCHGQEGQESHLFLPGNIWWRLRSCCHRGHKLAVPTSVYPFLSLPLNLSFFIHLPLNSLCFLVIWPNKTYRVSLKQGDWQRRLFSMTARTQWVLDSQAKFPSL